MKLNKVYKIKLAIMSFLTAYVTAALFVPALNLFKIILGGETQSISISKLIMANGMTDKELFNSLRNFMQIDGKTIFIEIFWYAMIFMFIMSAIMIVGVFLAWFLKKNKTLGFKMMFTSEIIYFICQIALLIVGMILLLSVDSIDSLDFVLMLNVPMIAINLIASVAYLVIGVNTFKHYRLPKLSETIKAQ